MAEQQHRSESAERLSLPLGFDLPEGWSAADPAAAGIPGAAYVALRGDTAGEDFIPNITIGIEHRPDSASIVDIADEAVGRIGAVANELSVTGRSRVGDPEAPGCTQLLWLLTGEGQRLVQTQVHLTVPGSGGPADRIVVELAVSCTIAQAEAVTPEFRGFVAGFHVRASDSPEAP